jgi:hypothetical protein
MVFEHLSDLYVPLPVEPPLDLPVAEAESPRSLDPRGPLKTEGVAIVF